MPISAAAGMGALFVPFRSALLLNLDCHSFTSFKVSKDR